MGILAILVKTLVGHYLFLLLSVDSLVRQLISPLMTAINEWVERRREWDEHVTRMDAPRLVKTSRDNIPTGRRSPGRLKGRL